MSMASGRVLEGEHVLARIFIREGELCRHLPLYRALVGRLKKEGFAGVTVVRGVEGFGARSQRLDLSADLPVIVLVVDTEERIQRLRDLLCEMVEGNVLVAMEKVRVERYGPGEQTPP
jgi:PII-like signaling protein